MVISTNHTELPPLPQYTLHPQPALVPGIPDKHLLLLLPVVLYWLFSLAFHYCDQNNLLIQYRLRTPVELLRRNRVSKRDVIRDVVIQQVMQTILGLLASANEPDVMVGKEHYAVVQWGRRIRAAQRLVPVVLAGFGINSEQLAGRAMASSPLVAGLLAGGYYPALTQIAVLMETGEERQAPAFVGWEMFVAKAIYWVLVPGAQLFVAAFVLDTWQYAFHRVMHSNQWCYRKFHSRHHALHVPYAFGALYNHPIEGVFEDTFGALLAFKLAGLSLRQGILFFTLSTLKTVDDHSGYALPWDPFQFLTGNNASYHDVHHQWWGMKTNYSQPFFTFWDRLLGTMWKGGDAKLREKLLVKQL